MLLRLVCLLYQENFAMDDYSHGKPCTLWYLYKPIEAENTKGCTRLKPQVEAENCFLSPWHFFLCLADWTAVCRQMGWETVGIFFTAFISLYGILPFLQLFHRSYPSVCKPRPINVVQNYTSKADGARIQLYFYDNFTFSYQFKA